MRSRRLALAIIAALAVATAGCTPGDPVDLPTTDPDDLSATDPVDTPPAPPTSSPAPVTPTTTPAPEPSPTATEQAAGPPEVAASWTPDESEVTVAAKLLAVDVVRHLTDFDPTDDLADRVASVPVGDGERHLDREAVAAAAEVLDRPGAWSRSRVEYPQLGGFRDDRISVMVVTEQVWRAAEASADVEPDREVRTIDVRLERDDADAGWQLATVDSLGGAPVRADPPSDVAAAVLEHPDLLLPDSARWDILAGDTTEELLELMLRIADRVPVEVAVLDSGHPRTVFGTDKPTKHAAGLAVDLHTVDGVEVVADRSSEDTTTYDLVAWLYDQPEVRNIGSPWALDDFGGRSFTDLVHQDHLHIVVEPDEE